MKRIKFRVDFQGHEWFFTANEWDKVLKAIKELKKDDPKVFKVTEYLDPKGNVSLTKSKLIKEGEQ